MGTRFIIESLAKTVTAAMEQGPRLSDATRSRLVWHVAIAGFALLNSRGLMQAIAGRELQSSRLVMASLPWIAAALFALAAHFLVDRAQIASHAFFVSKLALIDLLLEKDTAVAPDPVEFAALIHDTKPELLPMKRKADFLARLVNALELLSLVSIVVGLVLAVALPLLAEPLATAA